MGKVIRERAIGLLELEKKGIVKHICQEIVRGVDQNVWELNKEIYLKVRGEE